MVLVLLGDADGEFCLRQELVSKLARLGVTNVALVRDEQAVGIVLEGWLFDPARSASAAVEAIGAGTGARTLHPIMHLAVSTAADQGGQDGENTAITRA
jgi:hypothetical protein